MTEYCDSCGAPATHKRPYRDVCPTDRGDEVREGWDWLCDECDPDNDDPLDSYEKRRGSE